ncbi:hypothetical protein BLEM_1104 [Bifidobacterium lemurum]|uniref:Uncharacterized protein n=1 Tax=Bifidobacterium lemurum TaxID=1603886 RepID=A0A261FTX8_9BIFI|nr:hypothetical protein [Bifidobacterium lemurum]OZG62558.1 hypothetical protein BLEM_1104 [Bifidobacterium lemurum]QOL33890.1 hypothetical protein BL8807_08990 [Bifidobacterium lemurum]
MIPISLTPAQARLVALSPIDGAQDLYVSTMVGIPQARVRGECLRLRREAWKQSIARAGHPSLGERTRR